MAEQTPETGILTRLSLNHWYKYLLYLGGVILIVGFYFYLQYPLANSSASLAVIDRVIDFAVYTIVIGISLWILDEILYFVYNYLYFKENNNHDEVYEKVAIGLQIFEYLVWVIAFLIWISIALGTE
jgi:heme/copper-type cytochrome/quinol oxidase subunit 2